MKLSRKNYIALRDSIVILIALKIIIMCLVPAANAEDCSKLSWTKTSSRSQAGGWIWFPGKFTSDIRATSIMFAEGEALSYEAGECGAVHVRTKFNEKCVQTNTDGTFTTFVRASIKAKYCSEAMNYMGSKKIGKITHPILTGILNAYKMSNADNTVKDSCNKNNGNKCALEMYAAEDAGNPFLAAAYGKRACLFGEVDICSRTAMVFAKSRMFKDAIAWANQGCIMGDDLSCKLRGRIHKAINYLTKRGLVVQ